ncbi:hypothetical protein FE394_13470 [Xenorhabdus sp. Reich]|uniref:Uncharacterized protein n=1 Tax=Xenorhabdus littoralis TaxID=2582835 RepID=A0ABU4SNF0_9GAMM|nr:hypothetical protein [Xenorhabdus sp. Reich]MDX8000183.1 hypothetical protein [Xenorhabdus sp. Reich]
MRNSKVFGNTANKDLEKISASLSRAAQMIEPSKTDKSKGLFIIKSKADPLEEKLLEQCCIR